MKKSFNILALILLLFSVQVKAQKVMEKKAFDHYEALEFADATEVFEKLIHKGKAPLNWLKTNAEAYYKQAEYKKAFPYYRRVFRRKDKIELTKEDYFRYAHTLKSVKRYTEAEKLLNEFHLLDQSDSRGIRAIEQKDYQQIIEANSGLFEVGFVRVNSTESDYGPAYYKDQVVFTSARDTGWYKKRIHKWNNRPFTKFYVADIEGRNKRLKNPRLFAEELVSSYHESTPAFTKDGKTMYFTRNNYHNKLVGRNKEGVVLLKVFKAELINNQWANIEELTINSDEFSTAHPALSPDEKFLYFASDRPGGYGKSDLYKSQILVDGKLGEPENLGPEINTEGRESFPFVAPDQILYFASDGHPGLGGLDLFAAKKSEQGIFQLMNLGKPLNSQLDDFALILDENHTGFFTSNRAKGKYKSDNIYRIKLREKIQFGCRKNLRVKVVERQTEEILPNTRVLVFDANKKQLEVGKTNSKGEYFLETASCGDQFYVRAIHPDYEVKEQSIALKNESGLETLRMPLDQRKKNIKEGEDLAKILKIEEIYFDLDQWDIRPDAEIELQKVVDIMNKYPDIKIEIGSHTDSRASKAYNETLSENRAQSTRQWIVNQGINPERITAKGYGEYQLINHCQDDVPCSEEEHQENRRSEFIIIGMQY